MGWPSGRRQQAVNLPEFISRIGSNPISIAKLGGYCEVGLQPVLKAGGTMKVVWRSTRLPSANIRVLGLYVANG